MKLLNVFSHRKVNKLKLTNTLWELLRAVFTIKWRPTKLTVSGSPKIRTLENEFSKCFADAKTLIFPHARVGVQHILKAFNFPAGSEVVMTPLTIADMVNSIHMTGLKPKFVDIELETLNFDLDQLEQSITPNTKAILITYITGVVPNVDLILALAKKYDLKIIEDVSQAMHSTYQGRPLGSFGDAAVFSLTNFKIVSALFGGVVVTHDQALSAKLKVSIREMIAPDGRILSSHCFKNIIYKILFNRLAFSYGTYFLILLIEYVSPDLTYKLYSGNIRVVLGESKTQLLKEFPRRYSCQFTEPQAALALASFKRSEYVAKARRQNGELLKQALKTNPHVMVPKELSGSHNAYWRFPLITPFVDELKLHLLKNGIDSAKPFLTLCSEEPGFEIYHAPTPRAKQFKTSALILEVDETLNKNDILKTAGLIQSFFANVHQEEFLEARTH